ncbi:unnamed protein product, partial [Prorocentrum cordatum]
MAAVAAALLAAVVFGASRRRGGAPGAGTPGAGGFLALPTGAAAALPAPPAGLLEVRLRLHLSEARLQRLEALQEHHRLEAAGRQLREAPLAALADALGLGEASLERPLREETVQEAWCPMQVPQVSLLCQALEWLEAERPLELGALASESPSTALLEEASEVKVPRGAPLEEAACWAGCWLQARTPRERSGLSPGCMLEGVTLDDFGSAAETALFQVRSVWPGDGMECFVEAWFMGCSSASRWPTLAGSFTSRGGAVSHLCTQQASECAGQGQWPQRSVLREETYRMRSPSNLTEAWVQQPGGANPGAAAGPAAQPTPEDLQKKKIAGLKKRPHQKQSIGEPWTVCAEATLTRPAAAGLGKNQNQTAPQQVTSMLSREKGVLAEIEGQADEHGPSLSPQFVIEASSSGGESGRFATLDADAFEKPSPSYFANMHDVEHDVHLGAKGDFMNSLPCSSGLVSGSPLELSGESGLLAEGTEAKLSWAHAIGTGINYHYVRGWSAAPEAPPSAVQRQALNTLPHEVRAFRHQRSGATPIADWESELTAAATSHVGEEVFPAEPLDRPRLLEALPPIGACTAVKALDVTEGWFQAALSDPRFILINVEGIGDLPPSPRVRGPNSEWELLAGNLVTRDILKPTEHKEIVKFSGQKIMGGTFGVKKGSHAGGESPQSLVMNITPSNFIQHAIKGDMLLPPHSDKWRSMVPRPGDFLLWSAEELKCYFYVCSLCDAWLECLAFSKPVGGTSDDLDVLEFTAWRQAHQLREKGMSELAQVASEGCQSFGVPRSENKAATQELKSQPRGGAVDKAQGMSRPPAQFGERLVSLTIATLRWRGVTKKWMQVLAGRWARRVCFRREAMMRFTELWRVLVRFKGQASLPAKVREGLISALARLPLLSCDLRIPFCVLVTVCDANMQRGAVCRYVLPGQDGVAAARAASRRPVTVFHDAVALVSLFDGMGGTRSTLDLLDVTSGLFVSAEFDAEAKRVTKYAWPEMLKVGDAQSFGHAEAMAFRERAPHIEWFLLIGGSPCTDLARLSVEHVGPQGGRSELFIEISRIRLLLGQVLGESCRPMTPTENLTSMDAEPRNFMGEHFGHQPRRVGAGGIAHRYRDRLYWIGESLLRGWQGDVSVLEGAKMIHMPRGPSPARRSLSQDLKWAGDADEHLRLPTLLRCVPRRAPGALHAGLQRRSGEKLQRWQAFEYYDAPYQFGNENRIEEPCGVSSPPNSVERELPLDFLPGHAMTARVTSARRLGELELEATYRSPRGNSSQWMAEAWILAHEAVKFRYLHAVPSVVEMRVFGGGATIEDDSVDIDDVTHVEGVPIKQQNLEEPDAALDPSLVIVEGLARRPQARGGHIRLDTCEATQPDQWPRRPFSGARWTWRAIASWEWESPTWTGVSDHVVKLDRRVTKWIEWLCTEGHPQGLAGRAISTVQFLLRKKRALPAAGRLLRAWQNLELPRSVLPLPEGVLLVMAATARG